MPGKEGHHKEDGEGAADQGLDGSVASVPARFVDGLPPTLHILVSPIGPVFPGMMSPVPLLDARMKKAVEESPAFVGVLATRPDVQLLWDERSRRTSPVHPRSCP
jgi:hypothetical protein